MYAFLDRVDADAFEAIAAQAYVEMLEAGYTAVAEFHYVHHDPQGGPYDDPAELARRSSRRRARPGIALTLLPVLYAHGGFGGAPPQPGQRRFVHTLDSYARLLEPRAGARDRSGYALGVAPHSLRAVTPRELRGRRARAERVADPHPRRRAAAGGRRLRRALRRAPGRMAARRMPASTRAGAWCTRPTDRARNARPGRERRGRRAAPTTEANLGDGIFPARDYLDARRRASASAATPTSMHRPFAELRQLE